MRESITSKITVSVSLETVTPHPHLAKYDKLQYNITTAIQLYISTFPRPRRSNKGAPSIPILSTQQVSPNHNNMILLLVHKWGYDKPCATYLTWIRIVKAAANLVANDRGYQYYFSHTNIVLWDKTTNANILSGAQDNDTRWGSIVYVQKIELKRYLRELLFAHHLFARQLAHRTFLYSYWSIL